jgi:RNA polymerase sigma factor (sigma-70 family)
VDYLFLRERRREVSKKIKKIAKHRLGNFCGPVGFVILEVISIIVARRHPNEIYCFPCNVFLVRIDFRADLNSGSKKKEKTSTSGAFVTTRWSLILSGAGSEDGEKQVRAALAELCQIYWRPIFFFIARRGYSPEDAEDLTQDFFVRILHGDWLQKADPARGRFRSLLLTSLQNFLNDAVDRTRARKRGGDVNFVPWDPWMAEAPSEFALSKEALNSWPAERIFDAGWAATVVERALRRLHEECESKGRLRVFNILSVYLGAERDDLSYANLAAKLRVREATVKKLLYHMRQRYRFLLRDEVTRTVAEPADVEDELRYLCSTLAASSAQTA